jgi:hypothetical protein
LTDLSLPKTYFIYIKYVFIYLRRVFHTHLMAD